MIMFMGRLIFGLLLLSLAQCTEPGEPWYASSPDISAGQAGDVHSGVTTDVPEIAEEVAAVFENNSCMQCHSAGAKLGGLDLSTMSGLLAGGAKAGPSIILCDPDASPLVQVLEGGIDDGSITVAAMPMNRPELSAEDLGVIRDWIADGAGFPDCNGGVTGDEPEEGPDFERDIFPILESYNCATCHSGGSPSSGLAVGSVDALLDGGIKAGPAIIPCDSGSSPLIQTLRGGYSENGVEVGLMPPFGDMASEDDIATLSAWIDQGAGVETCSGSSQAESDAGSGEAESDAGSGDESDAVDESDSEEPGPSSDFDDKVKPILSTHCQGCHSGGSGAGGLSVLSVDSLLQGGNKAGPAIVPCDADASPLIQVVEGGYAGEGGDVAQMPLGGDPLADEEIATLRAWIDAGADQQDGCDGASAPGDSD